MRLRKGKGPWLIRALLRESVHALLAAARKRERRPPIVRSPDAPKTSYSALCELREGDTLATPDDHAQSAKAQQHQRP